MPQHLRELTTTLGEFYCPTADAHVTFHGKGRTTVCIVTAHGGYTVGIVNRHYKDKLDAVVAQTRALEAAVEEFSKTFRTALFKTYWVYQDMAKRVGVAEAA